MKPFGLGTGQQDARRGTHSVLASQKSFGGPVDFHQPGRRVNKSPPRIWLRLPRKRNRARIGPRVPAAGGFAWLAQVRGQAPEQLQRWIVEHVPMAASGESDGR
jgi:hypothetical protein